MPPGRLEEANPVSSGLSGSPVNVTLAGGSLYGASEPQDGQVNLVGSVNVIENSKLCLYDGTMTDMRVTDFYLDGNVNVAAGKTFEVLGSAWIFWPRADIAERYDQFGAGGLCWRETARCVGQLRYPNGAILSPGDRHGTSVGAFAMNRPVLIRDPTSTMIWGPAGKYHWEINDATGDVGAPFGKGWDDMIVRGNLVISATADSPFVIELAALQANGTLGPVQHLARVSSSGSSPRPTDRSRVSTQRSLSSMPATLLLARRGGGGGSGAAAQIDAVDGNATFWLSRVGNALYINARVV